MEYYIHQIPNDTTFSELFQDEDGLLYGFRYDKQKLLHYKGEDGRSNIERILEKYTDQDNEDEQAAIESEDLTLIKATTELLLPKGSTEVDLVAMTGRNVFVRNITKFSAFYGHYLSLLRQDGYSPQYINADEFNTIDIRQYNISVWVWSRAYSQDGTLLVDLSNFVESCTTNVNGTQNTFSLRLSVSEEYPTEMGDESLSQINLDQTGKSASVNQTLSTLIGTSVFIDSFPISWLMKKLQHNDIVFIRFEKLKLEKDEDRIIRGMDLPASSLPGKVYDMIGLIEDVSSNYAAEQTDLTIDIQGGDLTKLLIEDGSYFFPLLFMENSDSLFFNTQDDSKWFKRTFIKKEFENLAIFKMLGVQDALGFVVNQLSNLGVCNDELFASYDPIPGGTPSADFRGRRAQSIILTGTNKDKIEWNTVSGIWQIVDLLVDEQIQDRRITSSQISNPNSNLMGVVNSFCQSPFVEFFGDTYGDKYTFIARTPPYTKEAILSVLNSLDYIDVNLRNIERYRLDWCTDYFTWFSIDPRNMTLGKSDSMAMAYMPVIWFPEMAEAFGNKQFTITDNYISNRAIVGPDNSISHDEFRQKVVEDYLYVIESYCYLPFTQKGTFTVKRDRRLKAKTWCKIGNQFFYIDSVSNTFSAVGERIDGSTTLNVSRGMFIEYIRGNMIPSLGRVIDYWSVVKLDTIRSTIIEKMQINDPSGSPTDTPLKRNVSVSKNSVKLSFGTDKEAFDYFLQRKQMDNV